MESMGEAGGCCCCCVEPVLRGVSCCVAAAPVEAEEEDGVVGNLAGLLGGVGAGFLSLRGGTGDRPAGRGRVEPGNGLAWPAEEDEEPTRKISSKYSMKCSTTMLQNLISMMEAIVSSSLRNSVGPKQTPKLVLFMRLVSLASATLIKCWIKVKRSSRLMVGRRCWTRSVKASIWQEKKSRDYLLIMTLL